MPSTPKLRLLRLSAAHGGCITPGSIYPDREICLNLWGRLSEPASTTSGGSSIFEAWPNHAISLFAVTHDDHDSPRAEIARSVAAL
jgi:hypothetical protein